MGEKFVVTGGCGFVGHHIATLLAKSHKVLSIDCIDAPDGNENIDYLNIDIRQPFPNIPGYTRATVIHTAAVMNAKEVDQFWDVNVSGTKNVLKWSAKSQAKHFIFFSSGAVYGYADNHEMKETDGLNPIGVYGYTKWIGEITCQMYSVLYDLPVTIFRLYFPYGPGQQSGIFPMIFRSVASNQPLTIKGDGSPSFRPIHIDDLAGAVCKAIDTAAGCRIYNLCGDETVNFLDSVRLVENVLQRKITLIHSRENAGDLLADNSKIKHELSWYPRKKISEEAQNLANSLKDKIRGDVD
jgi:nucleoside-diphosphate-sugar epimerase